VLLSRKSNLSSPTVYVLTVLSLGPMITTGLEDVAKAFNVTTDQVSFNIVGLLQLTTGSGTFFTAAAAAVWGKRPVFFISTLLLLGTNAWGFFAGVGTRLNPFKHALTNYRLSFH
jgi:hypothetical protein